MKQLMTSVKSIEDLLQDRLDGFDQLLIKIKDEDKVLSKKNTLEHDLTNSIFIKFLHSYLKKKNLQFHSR